MRTHTRWMWICEKHRLRSEYLCVRCLPILLFPFVSLSLFLSLSVSPLLCLSPLSHPFFRSISLPLPLPSASLSLLFCSILHIEKSLSPSKGRPLPAECELNELSRTQPPFHEFKKKTHFVFTERYIGSHVCTHVAGVFCVDFYCVQTNVSPSIIAKQIKNLNKTVRQFRRAIGWNWNAIKPVSCHSRAVHCLPCVPFIPNRIRRNQ